ncbi:phosphomannose isomerase type I [Lepidopterella palustris CBS 459.81]|uniref:Mannose-6-phosphate isomerase n=1 Tax=Lepidopterella palustris CBS 459.81 TaxID=1314670 RepID=A0A8E2DWJ3_9PEZI|nr:phosphomannose isomerase type I [Lepidopterella palustris CBS 459.81]
MTNAVFQLSCQRNNYPWGKKGQQSLAVKLCEKTKEYAEMWMGDYPDIPAKSLEIGEKLQTIIEQNKEKLLGKKCIDKFGGQLPFLPKILSIQKAFPLQGHPNKSLATRLHQKNPKQFTDENHKPEIAIALSEFEVFAGWKPLHEIQPLFQLQPLQRFLPRTHASFNDERLRSVTQTILQASDDVIAGTQKALATVSREEYGQQAYILGLLGRLQQQYSQEDAVASIYIPADGIHAYLSGDIIECMARSNNVLNSGFCPRADRDSIELFSASLTFSTHSVETMLLRSEPSPKSGGGKTLVYAPPMSEFNMILTALKESETETIRSVDEPMVMIVTSGSRSMKADGETHNIKDGYVYSIGQGIELVYETDAGLEVYAAYAE